ncbi:MAG: hypothetical protein EBU96_08910 [Actinobacteria bacterium]|nr:hypothetical protein [Actinomycetota bacterium]
MQTPALFKPMNLGAGFGFFESDFDLGYSTDNIFDSPIDFVTNVEGVDIPYKSALDAGADVYGNVDNVFTNSALDAGADVYPNVAIVDNSGNVNANGKRIISADQIANIAKNNPGNEGAAIAKVLQTTAPEFTKQIKSYDDLVRAAANLFNTSKAVIQGKPIPQSIRSPYVYNPNNPGVYNPSVYRPSTATNQLSMSSTNMLLIGGVALAAFLVLRKK